MTTITDIEDALTVKDKAWAAAHLKAGKTVKVVLAEVTFVGEMVRFKLDPIDTLVLINFGMSWCAWVKSTPGTSLQDWEAAAIEGVWSIEG